MGNWPLLLNSRLLVRVIIKFKHHQQYFLPFKVPKLRLVREGALGGKKAFNLHLITRGAIIDVASHVTSLIVLILASCSADVELGGQPDFAASKVVRAEFSQMQAPNPKLYKCTDTYFAPLDRK